MALNATIEAARAGDAAGVTAAASLQVQRSAQSLSAEAKKLKEIVSKFLQDVKSV